MNKGGTSKSSKASVGRSAAMEAAAKTLVGGCTGTAVVVGLDASLIAANTEGAHLGALLRRGEAPHVAELVGEAASTGTVINRSLVLPSTIGNSVFDVTAVPVLDGEALLVLARDLTLIRYVRDALVDSRQRYKDLVEASSDFAWEVGAEGTFVFVSPRGALGYKAAQFIGQRPEAFVEGANAVSSVPFATKRRLEGVEIWMRRADGVPACVVVSAVPLFTEEGDWRGVRGVCRDVTEARELEGALDRARHREQLLNHVVGTFRDEIEPENMLAAAAASTGRALKAVACRIHRRAGAGAFTLAAEFGDVDEAKEPRGFLQRLEDRPGAVEEGMDTQTVLAAATRFQGTVNGAVCLWRMGGTGTWDDEDHILVNDVANHLGIAIEQIEKHQRIVKLSRTDPLTDLLNRRAFYEEELPRRLKRLERGGTASALYFVDLDNFKQVNDVHGHARGDEALMCLRDILIEHSRANDAIARVGGDEFALWIEGVEGDVAEKRAADLIAAGTQLAPFSGDAEHALGLSIGVALYDSGGKESLDALIARADDAMYAVKRAGKGGYNIAPAPAQGRREKGKRRK